MGESNGSYCGSGNVDGRGSRRAAVTNDPIFPQMFVGSLVLEPREVVERAIEGALRKHGYVYVRKPGEITYSILDYGPLNWRKYLGKPPLRVAFLSTVLGTARVTTFGRKPDLVKIIRACTVGDGFGFHHSTLSCVPESVDLS